MMLIGAPLFSASPLSCVPFALSRSLPPLSDPSKSREEYARRTGEVCIRPEGRENDALRLDRRRAGERHRGGAYPEARRRGRDHDRRRRETPAVSSAAALEGVSPG